MKKASLLLLFVMLMLPVTARADTPQPTPTQRVYSRSSLLSGIEKHPFTIQEIPGLDTQSYILPLASESGSWWLTIVDLLASAGAMRLIVGVVVLGVLAMLLRSVIYLMLGKEAPTDKAVMTRRGRQGTQWQPRTFGGERMGNRRTTRER